MLNWRSIISILITIGILICAIIGTVYIAQISTDVAEINQKLTTVSEDLGEVKATNAHMDEILTAVFIPGG